LKSWATIYLIKISHYKSKVPCFTCWIACKVIKRLLKFDETYQTQWKLKWRKWYNVLRLLKSKKYIIFITTALPFSYTMCFEACNENFAVNIFNFPRSQTQKKENNILQKIIIINDLIIYFNDFFEISLFFRKCLFMKATYINNFDDNKSETMKIYFK
jgi:hypothetical protein